MTVWRFDRGELGKARTTKWGFLQVPATVTRVGVQTYQMPNGTTRREFRPPEEVLSPNNLRSIASSVITNEHPAGGVPVTPKNIKDVSIGHADSAPVVRDGIFVDLGLTLTDETSMQEVLSGLKTAVSCGYKCRIDHTSGVWRGIKGDGDPEPYDVIQRGHENNHICITRKARGGSDVQMHLDSDDAVQVDDNVKSETREPMKIGLTIDGQVVEFDADVAAILKPALAKTAAELAEGLTKLDSLQTEHEKLKAKCDQAEADLKKANEEATTRGDSVDPEVLGKAVTVRLELMRGAAVLLDDKELSKLDTAPDDEVRALAVRKHTKLKLDADEKSDDYKPEAYITARFDALVEIHKGKGNKKLARGVVLAGHGSDERAELDERIAVAMNKADSSWRPTQPEVGGAN